MSFRQDGNEICVKYEQQKLVVKAIRDDIVNIFVPYRNPKAGHMPKKARKPPTEIRKQDICKKKAR